MGAIVNLIDAILFLFFIVIAIFAPLLDGQTCLPEHYYPKVLADLKSWYSIEFGDYLVVERPYFFVGLVWMELLLLWPLSVVNLFGLTYGKSWFNTTCLIFGVSMFSSMVAIMSEMIGSRRGSEKMMMMYFPFMCLAALAVLRGTFSPPSKTSIIGKRPALARKKRA
ncbi:hypothetical protein Nepgr_012874 [Nepenthes gracilis]|uniref:EXPERA domain-containing protein n=1 Tax=Nepenthes gracilis TaxID=150966 RepID=A0AAD3SGS0_NEPGR|nr:hypothetical protein Nepgr_012874 [Nepenthes gracilis]